MDKSCLKIENERVPMDKLITKLKEDPRELRKELGKSHHDKAKVSINCALELILQREGSTAHKAGYGTVHGNVALHAAQNLVSF